jgi:O-succinylbenzoate synthase
LSGRVGITGKCLRLDTSVYVFIIVSMNNNREQHQRALARGIKLVVSPKLSKSAAWKRVRLAAQLNGWSIPQLAADGLMAAVEATEDALS